MAELNYVEEEVTCVECGKVMKIVTIEGTDNSEYLCPKCSTGDSLEEEEDN